MAEHRDIDEMIGAYLAGQLQSAEREWMEQQLAADPALAELVAGLQREQRIEAFVEGEPTDAERQAFERALAEDERLRQAWEDYHLVRGAVKVKQREHYRQMLDKLHEEERPEGRRRGWWPWLLAVLSVALLLLLFLPGTQEPEAASGEAEIPITDTLGQDTTEAGSAPDTSGTDPGRLRDDPNLRAPASDSSSRQQQEGPNTRPDSLNIYAANNIRALPERLAAGRLLGGGRQADWAAAFTAGDYRGVINTLEPAADSLFTAKATLPLFLLGASYLLSADALSPTTCRPAARIFDRLAAESLGHQQRVMEQVNWYRIQALICLGQTEEALSMLRRITGQFDHPYRTEAIQMLRSQNESN